MEAVIASTRLVLVQGDLTRQDCDAIVNAANSGLQGGGGVDGAIHRAGGPRILEECREIVKKQGTLPPGQAVITSGGNLPARWVIHTVGPIWRGGTKGEAQVLQNAYRNSLLLAGKQGLTTVAFPSISTGAYGYPWPEAARIALETVWDFIQESEKPFKEIRFVLYSREIYLVYEKTLREVLAQRKLG